MGKQITPKILFLQVSIEKYIKVDGIHLDFVEEKDNRVKFSMDHILREDMYNYILDLKVMPSMRAMMTAGEALDRDNICGYNCSYIPINDIRSFDEVMYILMCGTGVGFSVEREYVEQLIKYKKKFLIMGNLNSISYIEIFKLMIKTPQY